MSTDLLPPNVYSEDQIKILKGKVRVLKCDFKRRWRKAKRNKARFLKENKQWLQGTFEMPNQKRTIVGGRPSKPFCELSERSKRRKTADLRKVVDKEVIVHAAKTTLHTSGNKNVSNLLAEITKSPKRAKKYKTAYLKSMQGEESQLTPLKALSLFVEADLSRRQYEIIRSSKKKIYPSYSILQKAKNNCYPSKDSYRVTETCSEVKLQDLLNHTVTRLMTYLDEIIRGLNHEECNFRADMQMGL